MTRSSILEYVKAVRGRYLKAGKKGKGRMEASPSVRRASDRLCSKRLKPFMGELVRAMRQHSELAVNARIESLPKP